MQINLVPTNYGKQKIRLWLESLVIVTAGTCIIYCRFDVMYDTKAATSL